MVSCVHRYLGHMYLISRQVGGRCKWKALMRVSAEVRTWASSKAGGR